MGRVFIVLILVVTLVAVVQSSYSCKRPKCLRYMKCSNGIQKNKYGCLICKCKPPKHVCGPVCAIFCEYGNVLDEFGCPTCICRKKPCPKLRCFPRCKKGVRIDRHGCPTCSCIDCRQPKKVGPCRASIPRYFYNKKTRKCEKFYWGGCQANGNNFRSLKACQKICLRY